MNSNEILKDKIIYLAGFLEKKIHGRVAFVEQETDEDPVDSDFITNLNRGGLTIPKISTVHFVHSAHKILIGCNLYCCRAHLSQAISCIDSPMAIIKEACETMFDIFLKVFVQATRSRLVVCEDEKSYQIKYFVLFISKKIF